MIRSFLIIGACLIIGFFVFTTEPAQAAGLVIDCNQTTTNFEGKPTIENPCTIQDFFQQFVIVVQFAYSIIILLGVLMFVYGGYQFLIAAGRQEKISEGKRVITGTIIGLMVSLSAFVIINFTVAAITGTTRRSLNPLNGIALVFPGQNIEQPFSGTGGKKSSSCLETWTKNCSTPQAYCADGTGSGPIRNYQKQLNDLGCQCGNPDGCYGQASVGCVRRFQIANNLPATGAIDQFTAAKITGSGTLCTGIEQDFVKNISSKLPEPSSNYSGLARKLITGQGCCVVQATVGGATQPYYCLNSVTERTCFGLGGNNLYKSGTACAADAEAKSLCGSCTDSNQLCLDNIGRYWCSSVISPAQLFTVGVACGNGGLRGIQVEVPFTNLP